MVQRIYLILCVVGTILPYSQFIPFLTDNGFDLPLFLNSILTSQVAGFAWWDVIISAFVLLVFVFVEGRRLKMNHLWLPVVALVVGVSLALPLFLYMRERKLSQI